MKTKDLRVFAFLFSLQKPLTFAEHLPQLFSKRRRKSGTSLPKLSVDSEIPSIYPGGMRVYASK
jgi:hypothetical protein